MHPAPWSRWLMVGVMVTAAACSSAREQAAAPPQPNVVTVTAVNYAFAMPDTIPAGLTQILLVNHGTELHHVQLVRLLQGRTVDSLLAALRRPGPLPAWAQLAGGPNATVPGDSARATEVLAAGHYAVLCMIPGPDKMPHFTKGMIRPLEVAAPAAAAPAEPAADVELHLKDYDFVLSTPLTAGAHTVRVVNDGPQPHEVVLAALAPGKSVQDLLAWVDGGMKGQPPAKPLGGVTGLAPGRHALWNLTLVPGNYGLICFFPGPDGREHAAHGMMKQFTVS